MTNTLIIIVKGNNMTTSHLEHFLSAPVHHEQVGQNTIAYRKFGKGPVLLMIHGWPLCGATYRFLIPTLQQHFTCIVPDSPGLGNTKWQNDEDLKFPAQANTFKQFMHQIKASKYHLLAHDTGATIARILAAEDDKNVQSLVLLNTEIMNHRPSPLPLYQALFRIPGASWAFKQLLKSKTYVKSSLGFSGCFYDNRLINDEFYQLYIQPLISNKAKRLGALSYLNAIDWNLVDQLDTTHQAIKAPLKLIWGTEDPFFPLENARTLIGLSPRCNGMVEIEKTALMAYEEQPEKVLDAAFEFWGKHDIIKVDQKTEALAMA